MPTRAKMVTISEDELKQLLRDVVQEAVQSKFEEIGLLAHTPEHRIETRKLIDFLRTMEARFDKASNWIGKAVVLALVSAGLAVVLAGLKVFGIRIDN